MSSTVLSAVAKLPWDLVLTVLEFDPRCVIRNGKLKRVVATLAKHDSRYSTILWMLEDHVRLYNHYAWNSPVLGRNQVGTIIPIGKYTSYMFHIYDAEYYNEQTGEFFYDLVREFGVYRRNYEQVEWYVEY